MLIVFAKKVRKLFSFVAIFLSVLHSPFSENKIAECEGTGRGCRRMFLVMQLFPPFLPTYFNSIRILDMISW